MEEEDRRREAAIASSPSLQSDFKPSGVTQAQLSKFQELHKRRLQKKAKSDKTKKPKVNKSRQSAVKDSSSKDENLRKDTSDSSVPESKNISADGSSTKLENLVTEPVPKKRQKLYWGLDTKQRWERKSNM